MHKVRRRSDAQQSQRLTKAEQALLVGIGFDSAADLETIAEKLGGWRYIGVFLYGVGVGLGVLESCKDDA